MNKKKIKATKHMYCSRCDKMIFPNTDIIVEQDDEGNEIHYYCMVCGKGYPISRLTKY